jgi:hypothetical protein
VYFSIPKETSMNASVQRPVQPSFLDYVALGASLLVGVLMLGMFGGVPLYGVWKVYLEGKTPLEWTLVLLCIAVFLALLSVLITAGWLKQVSDMWKNPADWEHD